MKLPQFYIDDIIKRAVSEDINYIDVTTDYLIPEGNESTACLVSKDEGVVAGIEIGLRVFSLLDPDVKTVIYKNDGSRFTKAISLQRSPAEPLCSSRESARRST